MTLLQFELYKEYHASVNVWDRYEIGREIVKSNRATPIPWHWLNDHDLILPGEIWQPINIPYFVDYVHVSDHGRIKRLKRSVGYRNGNPKNWPERILIPSQRRDGRIKRTIYVSGNKLMITPHRAVGLTFIPNPNNKPCINHIDGDPKNCHHLNLEWVTYSENEMHSYQVLGKELNPAKGVFSPFYKGAVNCLSKEGEIIKQYTCVSDVEADGFHPSHVYRVANGDRKTTGGHVWQWA